MPGFEIVTRFNLASATSDRTITSDEELAMRADGSNARDIDPLYTVDIGNKVT